MTPHKLHPDCHLTIAAELFLGRTECGKFICCVHLPTVVTVAFHCGLTLMTAGRHQLHTQRSRCHQLPEANNTSASSDYANVCTYPLQQSPFLRFDSKLMPPAHQRYGSAHRPFLSPPPSSLFSPSLISLKVSVDDKRHVYLLQPPRSYQMEPGTD